MYLQQYISCFSLQLILANRTRAEKVAPVTHLNRLLSAVVTLDGVGKYVKIPVPCMELAELAHGATVQLQFIGHPSFSKNRSFVRALI